MPLLPFLRPLLGFAAAFCFATLAAHAESPRVAIAKAIVTEDADEQVKLVGSLTGSTDATVHDLLTAWKEGGTFICTAPSGLLDAPEGSKLAVQLSGPKDADGKQAATRIDTGESLKNADGSAARLLCTDLDAADTSSDLRVVMHSVLELFAIASPDPHTRFNAISQMGLSQDPAQLPVLLARQSIETDSAVKRALREAIAQIQLKSSDSAVQIHAAQELGVLRSLSSRDALLQLATDSDVAAPTVAKAAHAALRLIEQHLSVVNFYGTLFRGLSLGSVLLVVAIGLAITFGLMGVINMAHGELIAVGAYATYLVQNIFGAGVELSPLGYPIHFRGFNAGAAAYDWYFVVALPIAFISAAIVGLILERCVIRFLYRRPLESLLATWGMSLVLQQLFRLVFGANNVQVYSPRWLSGNWTVFDVILGWNRVFVIGFAALIIAGTWLLLNKTPLGLLIRAVMQNRNMAACVGVRTERVNMLTFAFGSGLAGLAGAFLSQIGNVGPILGQDYIVGAFMTVVVGGVGSLAGTVLSALAIGISDQSLQQILLNPVLGKILVLTAIILFLQWKPAGLFVTRSRSLES